MGSPFPGMDPYLEGEMWQEFHETLASQVRAQLLPLVSPRYVALLAKRYVVDRPAVGVLSPGPGRAVYPDVHVATAGGGRAGGEQGRRGTAVAEPSAELASMLPEEVPQLTIEVRDVEGRQLVTAIEILSPANKRGEGVREYRERREELLRARTHLLELDLLRGGTRIELAGELPPGAYYVFLSQWQRRPITEVWAISLRESLPVVPVPLLPPDPDVALDLQGAVRACFELVGYERLLDYASAPPPPELDEEDARWVEDTLRASGRQGRER